MLTLLSWFVRKLIFESLLFKKLFFLAFISFYKSKARGLKWYLRSMVCFGFYTHLEYFTNLPQVIVAYDDTALKLDTKRWATGTNLTHEYVGCVNFCIAHCCIKTIFETKPVLTNLKTIIKIVNIFIYIRCSQLSNQSIIPLVNSFLS